MESRLNEILKKNRVKGVIHTHVSMGKIKGAYQFNREQLNKFWDFYTNIVNNSPDKFVGIAEKPQYYLPVLGDIDIKLKETDDNTINDIIHTQKHTKEVIQVYQSVLRNIVNNCTDKHLTCVLLEKPLYRVTKNGVTYAKHGFHIHFPYCFLSKVDQEIHFIPRVQKELKELNTFRDIGIVDSGSLIDKSCCKVPWLLYGSRKDVGLDPYIISNIYNSECEEITLEEAFNEYSIYDMKERLINIRGKINKYIPQILSIFPHNRSVSELKHGLVSPLKEVIRIKRDNNNKQYEKKSLKENLSIASKLLPLLSDFRAADRNEWMNIGWILYNIGDCSNEALNLWCEFSSRCQEHYDEAVCIYQWDRMTKKNYTLGTLRHFASIDSPEEYIKFKSDRAKKYIDEVMRGGSHTDIAKILYEKYGDIFICASISSKSWFQFKNHRWEQIEEGVTLRKKISDEIVDGFVKRSQELTAQLGHSDKDAEEFIVRRQTRINKMICNLKSAPYKNNIMKECMEVFYDKRFKEKLDTNPYLFPFNNGVYDLKTNIFRSGRPEDFISKCSPIDYIELSEDSESVYNVYDFLEKVFPDKSVRKYFLDVSSDIFLGGNHQKHVYFWTGEGDNAKSVTQNIFEAMLGKLSIKFNTTVITGKKVQSGGANPELARAGGGVRMATLEEPNNDEMINIGILKNLSGNDKYYARDLFEKGKEGREITPMFKLVFICNKLPKLKYSDKAVWNRIRVIPFESTFCRQDDPAPETYEEQLKQKRFPMDKNFGQKIPGMLQAFAWLLLKHRTTIIDRIEPEKVRMATAIYRKQNDVYRQFIEECIIEDPKHKISLTELYSQFKEWFRESLPSHTLPIKNEIEEYFCKIWGDTHKGKIWMGYRGRTLQDDIDNGDAIIMDDSELVDYTLPPM